jgi:tRNA threonylcarbamoyladenosine biosynthesis protein TsaB
MILRIDTASYDEIKLALLEDEGKQIRTKMIKAPRTQAEKLLPNVAKLLAASGLKLNDLSKIQVVPAGGSFTSLRIGVVTANALAYALNIPLEAVTATGKICPEAPKKHFATYDIIIPQYGREPNIGTKKKS